MNIPAALKRFRQSYNITQKQAAAAANTGERVFQKYEAGNSAPGIKKLIALADAFDVSIDYLVERTDNPKINR